MSDCSRTTAACIILVLCMTAPAFADVLTFSTYHNDITIPPIIPGHGLIAGQQDSAFTWNYTGNYTDPRLSTYILQFNNNNQVTICPNGACGNESYGLGRAYTGYEFIYFGFFLPANAVNIALNAYATIDDRAIIDVNGHALGGFGGTYNVPSGTTQQQLDGSGYHTESFGNATLGYSQTFGDQSYFLPGAENYIRFWINNTGTGILGTARPHGGYYDPTSLGTYGTISYDLAAVPEPSSLDLLAMALGGTALWLLKRRTAPAA